MAEQMGLVDFKSSDGWFRGWKWRHEIRNSVRLHGEAGDVDLADAEVTMAELRKTLTEGGYDPEEIFNMDESGLFYRCMPKRTYTLGVGDVRPLGRGTKAMKAKDRETHV